MNLYGYPLPTTPYLNSLQQHGNLFVFNDIVAPNSHTDIVISKLLTFSNYENESIPWFKQMNLIDTMKLAGFHTWWFSNQEAISIFGNAPQVISTRSDNLYNVATMNNNSSTNLDKVLLTMFDSIMPNHEKPSFFIFHLMGTHGNYAERYPHSFDIFDADSLRDYHVDTMNGEPLDGGQLYAKFTYANAVLYNDYIVHEIITRFQNSESIVFYLSDHGDEVYDFRNFVGHSVNIVSRNMLEVPFMIYVSDSFKQKYPKVIQRIQNAQNIPFMTDDFIHAFLDIVGVQSPDFIPTRSLFNEHYNTNRARIIAGKDYDKDLKHASFTNIAPHKIWLHRTDELEKFKAYENIYQNFEVDVHFLQSDEKTYFDVGHDGREYSIGLDLKEMFALAQTRSVYPHKDSTNTKFWIDFKNLTEKNAKESLEVLLQICEETNMPIQNLIIESPNYESLGIYKKAGFYTSYYVPYYTEKELQHNSRKIQQDIQHIIDSGNINAISFAAYLYPFLKELQFNIIEEVGGEKREKPIDLLTWNESTNWVTNMATEMYQDSQVQVILAGETGKWR